MSMFKLGEKVFYPLQGAGIVEAIEVKEIQGEKIDYYRINLPFKKMQMMIPMNKAEELGVRKVSDPDRLEKAKVILRQKKGDISDLSHQRTRLHTEKLLKGDILEESQVICDLIHLKKERKEVKKNLSVADKTLLENACQIFISELALIKDISQEQATRLFRDVVSAIQ